MATSRRGFAKERHAAMKSVVTGLAVSGFVASWVAFANAHPAPGGDDFQVSPNGAEFVLEAPEQPTPTPTASPTFAPVSTPTVLTTAVPATAVPATATATQRASTPSQGATQAPAGPTSTPIPATPVPANPTTTAPAPTVGSVAPKPTATKAPKKTRGS